MDVKRVAGWSRLRLRRRPCRRAQREAQRGLLTPRRWSVASPTLCSRAMPKSAKRRRQRVALYRPERPVKRSVESRTRRIWRTTRIWTRSPSETQPTPESTPNSAPPRRARAARSRRARPTRALGDFFFFSSPKKPQEKGRFSPISYFRESPRSTESVVPPAPRVVSRGVRARFFFFTRNVSVSRISTVSALWVTMDGCFSLSEKEPAGAFFFDARRSSSLEIVHSRDSPVGLERECPN